MDRSSCHLALPQVQAAPKRAPKPKTEKGQDTTEPMEPKTFKEKVSEKVGEWLKLAGQARTSSLTLSSLEFADELATKLLAHATSMEKTYVQISQALNDKKTKDKEFENLIRVMNDKIKNYDKLQAGQSQKMVLPNIYCICFNGCFKCLSISHVYVSMDMSINGWRFLMYMFQLLCHLSCICFNGYSHQ